MTKLYTLILALAMLMVLSGCCVSHNYVETVRKEATCSDEGIVEYECSNCGETKKEVIPLSAHDYEYIVAKEATLEHSGVEKGTCKVCGYVQEREIKPFGSEKSNPIVVSLEVLVEEINSDTDAAKAKYNDKWIKITGTVKKVYSSGGLNGHYLYGDRGDSGLRIICWTDGKIGGQSLAGEEVVFVGQMREVTTFNATEIVDCEIASN